MPNLWTIAIVPLLVWVGVFAYLITIDMKIGRRERRTEDDDL